jgi:hypothetical protein
VSAFHAIRDIGSATLNSSKKMASDFAGAPWLKGRWYRLRHLWEAARLFPSERLPAAAADDWMGGVNKSHYPTKACDPE